MDTQAALTTVPLPGQHRAIFGRRRDGQPKTFWESTLLQWVVSIGTLLLTWQLIASSGLLPDKVLPAPYDLIVEARAQPNFLTLAYIPRRGNFFNLPTSIFLSLLRVVLGLASAFIASLLTGLLITYVPLARRLLLPIIRLLAPISPIAWMPLIVVFLGVGEPAIVFVIFIALFFILTLSTILSIEGVERVYINAARVMGASRWQTMLFVTLPAILPELFLTLRLNFFAAWLSLLVAEFIGAKTGLGQMVIAGRGVFNMRLVILAMVAIGISGMLCEWSLRIVQDKVLWWRRQAEI